MSDDTENVYGEPNRETWKFNMHVANDEPLYRAVLAYAEHQQDRTALTIGRNIKDGMQDVCVYGREATHPMREYIVDVDPAVLERLRNEVGSFWRVDERSVGENILDALGIEDTSV